MALNTRFLDEFGVKYLTGSEQRHLRLWHLVTLVRADPAAERREYNCRFSLDFDFDLFSKE